MTAHWSDDPTNDIDWNNYSTGWDAGRRGDAIDPAHNHGQPWLDGYHDGLFDRHNS